LDRLRKPIAHDVSKEGMQYLGRIQEGQKISGQELEGYQKEFRKSRLGMELAYLFAAGRYALPTLDALGTVARKLKWTAHFPSDWADFPHKTEKPLKLVEINNMMSAFAQKPKNFFALRQGLFRKMALAPDFTKVLLDFDLMPERTARADQGILNEVSPAPKSAINDKDYAGECAIGTRLDNMHTNQGTTGSSVECSSGVAIMGSGESSPEEGVCLYLCVCAHVCMNVCMYIYMNVCVYIYCMYMCMYVCMSVCVPLLGCSSSS